MIRGLIRRLNISDIYIACWLIVYIITSAEPNIISGRLMLLLIAYSFFCFLKTIKYYQHSIYLKGLSVLTIFFSVYGIIHLIFGETLVVEDTDIVVDKTNYIKGIYYSLLTIYAFVYFGNRKLLALSKLKVWSIVFFLVAIVQYYNIYNGIAESITNGDHFTNNAGYVILSLFPLISIWTNRSLVQIIYGVLIVIFCILSVKRGAILISIICFAFYLYHNLKSVPQGKRLGILFLFISGVAVLYLFIREQLADNYYLYSRLQRTLDGDTSGRDDIFTYFIHYYINEMDFFAKLFGGGAENTIAIFDNYAHNDWIEILINNGLLGFFVYVYYWGCLFKEWRKSKNDNSAYLGLGMVLIIYFLMTLFSMSYNSYKIYSTIVIGYFISMAIQWKSSKPVSKV